MIIKWTPEVFPDTAFSGGTGSHQPSIVKTKPILKNPTLTALKAREDKDVSLCLIINFSNMTLSSPPLKTPCHSSRTTPATTPGLSLTSSGGNIPKLRRTGKLSRPLWCSSWSESVRRESFKMMEPLLTASAWNKSLSLGYSRLNLSVEARKIYTINTILLVISNIAFFIAFYVWLEKPAI